ncbi:Hypothetical protein FKW44_000376, partial [Caligus rogercresseyi]
KSMFCKFEIAFPGHVFSESGILPIQEKLQQLFRLDLLRKCGNLQQIRSLLSSNKFLENSESPLDSIISMREK